MDSTTIFTFAVAAMVFWAIWESRRNVSTRWKSVWILSAGVLTLIEGALLLSSRVPTAG